MSTRRGKRQGTIEAPRGTIKTTREKVIVETKIRNKLKIKTMIITTFETESSITIYIGSSEIYCIDCQLLKNKISEIYETGILTKARWDSVCSLDDPFKKGEDSIIIIKTLLSYINSKYPSVKQVYFTDLSTKECDDGSSVSLVGMKVFTDGTIWYETHFDVEMDEPYRVLYETMKSNAIKKKENMLFDNFICYSNRNIKISIDDLRNKYNTTTNWQDFFSYIRNEIGVSEYCKWLGKDGWFDTFIYAILKFTTMSLQFIFKVKQYDDINYKIMNYTGGKYYKSNTRKRLRR
jgi:hypothetical protein